MNDKLMAFKFVYSDNNPDEYGYEREEVESIIIAAKNTDEARSLFWDTREGNKDKIAILLIDPLGAVLVEVRVEYYPD